MIKLELINYDLDLDKAYDLNANKIEFLRKKIKDDRPFYKVLNISTIGQSTEHIENQVKLIKSSHDSAIIIGMGGANLNPASFVNAIDPKNDFKVRFLTRTEPESIERVFEGLDLKNTAVISISKSGSTLETIALLSHIIKRYEDAQIKNFKDHFFFITSRNDSSIMKIANHIGVEIFEHQDDISGRFSGFSNVSLIPAGLVGLDISAYISGAQNIIEGFLKGERTISVEAALATVSVDKSTIVNVSYTEKLDSFMRWNSQIIAESLGKNGNGYTPISSIGPDDQHSLFQLFLSGPDDKQYIYYWTEDYHAVKQDLVYFDFVKDITNKTMGEIHQVNQSASFLALEKIGKQLQKIIFETLNETTLGALVADSMLRIIIIASIMGVNPFDQPGVDLIKSKTRAMIE